MPERFALLSFLVDPVPFAAVEPEERFEVRRVFLSTTTLPTGYCSAQFAEVVLSESIPVDRTGAATGPARYAVRFRGRKDSEGFQVFACVEHDSVADVFGAFSLAPKNSLSTTMCRARIFAGGDLGFFRVVEHVGGPLDGVLVAEVCIPEGQLVDVVDFAERWPTPPPWARSSASVLPPWLLRRPLASTGSARRLVDVTNDDLELISAGVIGDDGPRGRFYNLKQRLPAPLLDDAEVLRAAVALAADERVVRTFGAVSGDLERFRLDARRTVARLAEVEFNTAAASDSFDIPSLTFGPMLRPRMGYSDAFRDAVVDRCAVLLSPTSRSS